MLRGTDCYELGINTFDILTVYDNNNKAARQQ